MGDRLILVSRGQKPSTRIILGILEPFLRFLKAKYINTSLK